MCQILLGIEETSNDARPGYRRKQSCNGNTQPVRTGSVRRDEFLVGGRERVKLLVFPEAGWQRHDLGALSCRQQITPWHCIPL